MENLHKSTKFAIIKFHFSDEKLNYTVLQTVNKWLKAINMDQYTNSFLDKGLQHHAKYCN